MSVTSYIGKLPLEKTKQIHISGARKENGQWRDAHEALSPEDFQLLEWVLGNCDPIVVTLEYFRKKDTLREQILRLQEKITDSTLHSVV